MIETFVNFRPKELWPKRAMKFEDASRQTRMMLTALEERGYVQPAPDADDRDALINDAAMSALGQFDETMRALALERYREFEQRAAAGADAVRRGGDGPPLPCGRRSELAGGRRARSAEDRQAGPATCRPLRLVARQEPGPGRRDRRSRQAVAQRPSAELGRPERSDPARQLHGPSTAENPPASGSAGQVAEKSSEPTARPSPAKCSTP